MVNFFNIEVILHSGKKYPNFPYAVILEANLKKKKKRNLGK